MTLAWKSSFSSGQKIVLLSLCDNANEQGDCYPSISMMAEKCSMSERSVFNQLDFLEKVGAISKSQRTGRSTLYKVNPCKFCTPANSAPLQPLHPTPATIAPITINESSIEPKKEEKTVSCKPKLAHNNWQHILEDLNVNSNHARDWLKVRGKSAMTETALKAMQREAGKAGISLDRAVQICAEKNWRGFNATWQWDDVQTGKGGNYEPPYARYMREKMEQISPSIAAKNPNIITKKIDPNEFLRTIEAKNVVRIN